MKGEAPSVVDEEQFSSGLRALVFRAETEFELDAILGRQEIAGHRRQ